MKIVTYLTPRAALVLALEVIFLGQAIAQKTPRESAVAAFGNTLNDFLTTKDVAKAERGFEEALKLDRVGKRLPVARKKNGSVEGKAD